MRRAGLVLLGLPWVACTQLLGIGEPGGGGDSGGDLDGGDGGVTACAPVPALGPPSNYGIDGNLIAIAVGDLDHDALRDLAVLGAGGAVTIWHGSGGTNLTRTLELTLPMGCQAAHALAVGDLNKDTRADVAVGASGGPDCDGAWWFRQLSTMPVSFAAAERLVEAPMVSALAIRDLDQNVSNDLIVLGGGQLLRLYQDAATPAMFTIQPALMAGGAFEGGLAIVDLDEDQDLDLAAVAAERATIFFQGPGLGSFGAPTPLGPEPVRALAAGDVDGDQREDLVIADSASAQIFLQSPTSAGTFTQGPMLPLGAPVRIELVDLNGDGRLDVFSPTAGGSYVVQCAAPAATGDFDGEVRTFVGGDQQAYVADVDADGLADLVAPAGADGVTLRLGAAP